MKYEELKIKIGTEDLEKVVKKKAQYDFNYRVVKDGSAGWSIHMEVIKSDFLEYFLMNELDFFSWIKKENEYKREEIYGDGDTDIYEEYDKHDWKIINVSQKIEGRIDVTIRIAVIEVYP